LLAAASKSKISEDEAMPKYNDTFKLNLKDIELIEQALHRQIHTLANARLEADREDATEADIKIREYHQVLGKLHNQKIWYGQTHETGVPLG
jgi:hypothetical protein